MKKGFTLIELLVVVLIIGILSAVAVPQYQKAVERSRMAEAVQALGTWATAQSIFYMHKGVFAHDFEELSEVDPTLADPTAAGRWRFYVKGGVNSADMGAIRDGGIFDQGELRMIVKPSGELSKECYPPLDKKATNGFCPMAESAGYKEPKIEAGELKPIGGGVSDKCKNPPCKVTIKDKK